MCVCIHVEEDMVKRMAGGRNITLGLMCNSLVLAVQLHVTVRTYKRFQFTVNFEAHSHNHS